MHLLQCLLLYLSFTYATPAPPDLSSVFEDDSIPVVEFSRFKLGNHRQAKRSKEEKVRCFEGKIVLDGRHLGNQHDFEFPGKLYVCQNLPTPVTTNGRNTWDIAIAQGDARTWAIPGMFDYVSNGWLNPYLLNRHDRNQVLADYAFVTSGQGKGVEIKPDPHYAAANKLSTFRINTTHDAVYEPTGGEILLTWKGTKIEGHIHLTSSSHVAYKAKISGDITGQGTITVTWP
ncbi:hypothetical protein FANTH_13707 [Fusarium anthophilum]|uniref:Uncharacterized protein n=1 Tax=Fusarium anthophilum TaxID=48485 RepID=A0A8H4YMP1_9HYPO|nr:hypothetical protein FANTH_13707 [Fusarium anthophilum]